MQEWFKLYPTFHLYYKQREIFKNPIADTGLAAQSQI